MEELRRLLGRQQWAVPPCHSKPPEAVAWWKTSGCAGIVARSGVAWESDSAVQGQTVPIVTSSGTKQSIFFLLSFSHTPSHSVECHLGAVSSRRYCSSYPSRYTGVQCRPCGSWAVVRQIRRGTIPANAFVLQGFCKIGVVVSLSFLSPRATDSFMIDFHCGVDSAASAGAGFAPPAAPRTTRPLRVLGGSQQPLTPS